MYFITIRAWDLCYTQRENTVVIYLLCSKLLHYLLRMDKK